MDTQVETAVEFVDVTLPCGVEAKLPRNVADKLAAQAGKLVRVRAAYRDLNAKGNGEQTYRRALVSQNRTCWLTEHPDSENAGERMPRLGGFRASERHCEQSVSVPAGTVILDYESSVNRFHAGKAVIRIGLLLVGDDGKAAIYWEDKIGWDSARRGDDSLRLNLGKGNFTI